MRATIGFRTAALLAVALSSMAGIADAAIPATEREVLVGLYAATHGEGWAIATNWNGAAGTDSPIVGSAIVVCQTRLPVLKS